MRAPKTIRLRLRSLFRRRRVDHELADELRDHLERQVEHHISAGLSVGEARAAALRDFGSVPLIQEQCRDTRHVAWLEDLVRDVGYALRSLRRAPGHAAVAVLSLAVAVGANTATFSLVNTLLLRELPVENPADLVELGRESPSGPGNFSYPLYARVRDGNSTLVDVLAMSSPVIRADGEGSDRALPGRYVSGNFFQVLGVGVSLGRNLTRGDDRVESPVDAAVAVISHGLWQRAFGADPGVLGRSLTVRGNPSSPRLAHFAIVGVLPQGFQGLTVGRADDFYVPMASEPLLNTRSLRNSPAAGWLKVVGRRKAGVAIETVRVDLNVLYKQFVDDQAATSSDADTRQRRAQRVSVEVARAGLAGPRREFGRPLLLLLAAVALVLLVACANVVNLLLARGLARRREIGVRLAIGASRGRLVRQLLAESAVLGLIGGAVGLTFAVWGTPRIATLMANGDSTVAYDFAPDAVGLLFTLLVALASAVLAGLAPALRLSRTRLPSIRDEGGARTTSGSPSIWTRALLASQVALSMVLLAGAFLLMATLQNLRHGNLGFDPEGVVTLRLEPGRAGYTGERRLEYFRAVLERVRSTTGVRAAALALGPPAIGAGVDSSFAIEGRPSSPEAQAFVNDVSDGYFAATGTRLLVGRDFGPEDTATSPAVAIVNDAAVKRYFGAEHPIGQRVHVGVRGVVEIVGVVETTKYQSLREADSPIVYTPVPQSREVAGLSLIVNVDPAAASQTLAIRRDLQQLAPVPVSSPSRLVEEIDRTLVRERLIARVLGVFALLAVALATAGLYGVLSYSIARRTSEIGIRFALGATRSAVIGPVIAESARVVTVGLVVGVPAALWLTRVLSNLLYGVSATDARVLGAVAALLFLVAMAAASVPAWRASRVDPLEALRLE